jgi:hypothetical protein
MNLPHEDNVERCVQCDCDRKGDRYATAREREHDGCETLYLASAVYQRRRL